jgi:inositol-polyphosphate multikinase
MDRGYLHSIVLENLAHSFLKPNILDIKLGTVLYDQDASEEKRARMERVARETTSLETGIRLTGFQVACTDTICPLLAYI